MNVFKNKSAEDLENAIISTARAIYARDDRNSDTLTYGMINALNMLLSRLGYDSARTRTGGFDIINTESKKGYEFDLNESYRRPRKALYESRKRPVRKMKEFSAEEDTFNKFCTFIETMPDDVYEALFASVHDWYKKTYPEDELADDINREASFNTVLDDLYSRRDVYRNLADDSLVRERVFSHICEVTGMSYDLIYGAWLG